MEVPRNLEDEKALPPPGVSENHWNRICKLKDKFQTIREKHMRREENIKKKKDLKALKLQGVAPANNEQQNETPKSKTEEFSWSDIQPYLNINKHLVQTTGTNRAPKSGLEKKLEEAIARRDADEVMIINDRLAARNLAKQITDACDAKRFVEKRKADEERKSVVKKKKFKWGFEQKQRWETKGNM